MSALDLGREARSFAQEIQDLLDAALPGERQIEAVRFESRYVVQPVTRQGNESVPLMFAGDLLATLRFSYQCAEDHVGDYLVVQRSRFGLYLASVRTPLVRLEYTPDLQGIPSAHWHFHAERGAFTELLTRQSSRTPHELSSLHLPVGGARMRPCLEDFVEFVIRECGADHHPDWEEAVTRGRERWRRKQLAALVRDVPEEAVRVLRGLGYEVRAPEGAGPTTPGPRALRAW